jgi:hypothetical protein
VWAGSLIVFTLNRKYTAELQFGLDYIAQAVYVPLTSLALPHPLFRLGACVMAGWYMVLLFLQAKFARRFRSLKGHTFKVTPVDEQNVYRSVEDKDRTLAIARPIEDSFPDLIFQSRPFITAAHNGRRSCIRNGCGIHE